MIRFLILLLSLAGPMVLSGCDGQPDQRFYYAIEENGVAMGWVQVDLNKTDPIDGGFWQVEAEAVVRTNVLDQPVDHWQHERSIVDPITGQMMQMERKSRTGKVEVEIGYVANDSTVTVSLPGDIQMEPVDRTADLHLDSNLWYTYLLEALPPGSDGTLNDKILDIGGQGPLGRQVAWVSTDTLTLADTTYVAQVYKLSHPDVGISMTVWVDQASGLMVKRLTPNGGVMVLTDADIKSRISRVKMDDHIICTTNDSIAKPDDVTSMKLRVVLHTIGEKTTVESLNTPGQQFTGTVQNNRVDGIFELTPLRYDGVGAPGFPWDQAEAPDLAPFLAPEMFIESDDPDIVTRAKDLSAGATDSWDAAVRLSRWVGDEIGYAIPGGGTAKRTLQTRKGECGAHTRLLVALCRAVGIPARFVMGGMYFNGKTAGFGQHAWTEIYMGPDVGWVPVDATARQYAYIDGGHIRLGEKATFHPTSIEILAYTLRPD